MPLSHSASFLNTFLYTHGTIEMVSLHAFLLLSTNANVSSSSNEYLSDQPCELVLSMLRTLHF